MEIAEKFLCLAGGQRAGTTALQSALGGTGRFHDFGEIFQTADDRRQGSFLDYAADRDLKVTDMANEPKAVAVTNNYLAHLATLAAGKFPLIDIKFNSWNALRSFWGYPSQEPAILRQLHQRDAAFIFVARKDLAAQIISEHIARAAAKWHDLTAEDMTSDIEVPVPQAVRQARMVAETEKLLFDFFRPTKEVFPVWYEDLYAADGTVNAGLTGWLDSRFSLDLQAPLRPKIRKNTVSKKSVVRNFDEVTTRIEEMIARVGRVRF